MFGTGGRRKSSLSKHTNMWLQTNNLQVYGQRSPAQLATSLRHKQTSTWHVIDFFNHTSHKLRFVVLIHCIGQLGHTVYQP